MKHIHVLYTLAFVFRCHKDTPIEPFKDYFKRRGETHEYELRNNENLSTNKICLNTGKTTTHTSGALLWNNCPTNITDLDEIGPLKKFVWILFWDVSRLNYHHTLLTMSAVRDRLLNQIAHSLNAYAANRKKGITQCMRLEGWAPLWHAGWTPHIGNGHCMWIITSFIHVSNISGLTQGRPTPVR